MTPTSGQERRWRRNAAAVVDAAWFQNFIIAVIVANAVAIGVSTFNISPAGLRFIHRLDQAFLAVFVVELPLRMADVGFNLRSFFGNGWNVFDFVVVAACFVPGLSSNSTALRLVRLARVSRLFKLMPDLAVLLRGLRKASGPALSLLALTIVLCYLYAVVGWILFHDRTPPGMRPYFANLGESMLTLFELLTLEGWNALLHDLRDLHPLALPYIISFLLIGAYTVINLVVGVAITSLDEAHSERTRERHQAELTAQPESVSATVAELKELIARLELQVGADPSRSPGDGGLGDAEAEAATGWRERCSHSLRSVLVKCPNPRADHRLLVSFEPFDMIGI